MTMLWDCFVLYCRMLNVIINYKSSLSMVFWYWLLVVGRSKIWTFARAVNLLAFSEVVCKKSLLLLEYLLLLPVIEAKGWEFCAWGLVFIDRNLCYGHGDSLIFLEFFLFGELVFDLTSCKCGVFCFAAFILRYFFFLYSHRLSYDVWAALYNRYFCTLSWEHFKVLCGPKQTPHFVLF